jgi:hypothetical protein
MRRNCSDNRDHLWKEHQDAVDEDYVMGIGVPEGCDIGGTEWRRGLRAQRNIDARILEVRANPSGFSEYTVEFVNSLGEPRERQIGAEPEDWSDEDDVVPF